MHLPCIIDYTTRGDWMGYLMAAGWGWLGWKQSKGNAEVSISVDTIESEGWDDAGDK